MIDIRPAGGVERVPNVTPLVDIVFLLLIFFLLTAFFIRPEGLGVRLPEADAAPVESGRELTVVVEKDGRILVGESVLSLDELESAVERALSVDPDRTVVIKADRDLVLEGAVRVMDRCQRAGARRLVIATERPSQ